MTDRVYRLAAYRKQETGRLALAEDGIFLQGGSEVAGVIPARQQDWTGGLISNSKLMINPQAARTRDNGPA